MPILQNEIQIKLTSNVISYYENLGYEIPRYLDGRGRYKVKENTKIIVDIKDLKKGSGIRIHMKCDVCGKEFKRAWRDNVDRDGKVRCNSCSGILRRGEKAYNWNSSISNDERINGRDYQEYHDFVKRVLCRDNHSCKVCGEKNGICVHHLNGYSWDIEGRVKDSNAITLCHKCHNSFHSIYGKRKNTIEQFEEWIGQLVEDLGEGVFPAARRVICMDDGNIIESAPLAAKQYLIDRNSLYPVLNKKACSVYGKHFLWYDEYLEMDKESVNNYWRWILKAKK